MDSRPLTWRPLRLLLVSETFPPEVNGVARTLGRWMEAFRDRGHHVDIVRPRQAHDRPAVGLVHGMPLPFYRQVRFGVASPLRLRKMLAHFAPDLVHIATEGPLGWAALVAARFIGLPVASSFHTNFDHYFSHYGLPGLEWSVARYLRWFHNRTAVTLVPSEATRRRLLANGVRDVVIWSRGVDSKAFSPVHRDERFRRSLGLDADDVLLLYVGRLAPEKNLRVLLDAFARLLRALPESQRERVRLALVGDGPEEDAIRNQQHPHVLLPGQQLGADLARWYASSDVFAFPSCSETFGNVVLEAQASGLPVVGFDTQGVNERVHPGIDGLLVATEGDLAESLRALCVDREKRTAFGRAGRTGAEKQDWKPIFDRLEMLYLQVARGK